MAFGIDDALMAALSLAGPAATLYGANQASRGNISPDKVKSSQPGLADPLLASLTSESQLGLGEGSIETLLNQSSPLNQIENEILANGQMNEKQKRRSILAVRAFAMRGLNPYDESTYLTLPGNIEELRPYATQALDLLGNAGFKGWDDIVAREAEHQKRSQEFLAFAGPLSDTIRRNRLQGQANLADIAGNAGGRIDELAALYGPQIGREFQDQRNTILQSANAGRFNPGAALGRLGETQALTQQSGAIERALQILGGQVNLTQGALAPAQNFALQTSGQRQNATLNAANIGAAQLQGSQQLQQQRNENLGTGTAAAGSQLGNLGLLMTILNQQSSGPGAPPSQNSVMANQGAYNPVNVLGLLP